LTLETCVELEQRESDSAEKCVHSLALLDAHDDIRCLLLGSHVDVEHGEVGRELLSEFLDQLLHDIFLLLATASRATSLDRKNVVEEGLTSSCEVTDFGVRVKTEHLRGLLGEFLFDVLAIGFTVEFQRVGALETWGTGQLHTVEDLRANKDLEIGIVRASIPAISNVTTVHNFTIDVAEIIIGDLFILGEVVVEHITTNSKITIVEVVVTGPTLATELLTTENK